LDALRKASEEDRPLQQIFDDVCRQTRVLFWRRNSEAILPQHREQDVQAAQTGTTSTSKRPGRHPVKYCLYAHLNGNLFYRGLSEPDDRGSAPVFANTQLDLLKDARHVKKR